MVNGQWHLYISPHFFVAMGHPTSHLSYGMNLSSYLTTHHFSYFFPFPQGHSNGFRTATLKGPRELDERNIERKGHLFFNGKKTWKIFDCLKQSNTWGVIRLHTIIPYHICISLDSWCYTLNVAGQITIYHHITVGLPASSWLNHHVFWLNHVKSTFFIIFLG